MLGEGSQLAIRPVTGHSDEQPSMQSSSTQPVHVPMEVGPYVVIAYRSAVARGGQRTFQVSASLPGTCRAL